MSELHIPLDSMNDGTNQKTTQTHTHTHTHTDTSPTSSGTSGTPSSIQQSASQWQSVSRPSECRIHSFTHPPTNQSRDSTFGFGRRCLQGVCSRLELDIHTQTIAHRLTPRIVT
eukprot:GHVU01121285.1.p1 GENE.GHVU01121285.1~~GHVU01121285.1.p1  ORF type:complete len:114 (-),score=7.47 GHVU01121285.1:160-501(-)